MYIGTSLQMANQHVHVLISCSQISKVVELLTLLCKDELEGTAKVAN